MPLVNRSLFIFILFFVKKINFSYLLFIILYTPLTFSPLSFIMDLFIKNATLISDPGISDIIPNSCVFIENGIIEYVGNEAEFNKINSPNNIKVIDAKGKLLLPGEKYKNNKITILS